MSREDAFLMLVITVLGRILATVAGYAIVERLEA